MNKRILLGLWRYLLPIPPAVWKGEVQRSARSGLKSLAFMSTDHHRVRDFAVRELPRLGRPIDPQDFVDELDLPLERVQTILDELEKNMTFLFRNPQGQVTWAYPVTVDPTPHRVTFSSGEKLYAA